MTLPVQQFKSSSSGLPRQSFKINLGPILQPKPDPTQQVVCLVSASFYLMMKMPHPKAALIFSNPAAALPDGWDWDWSSPKLMGM